MKPGALVNTLDNRVKIQSDARKPGGKKRTGFLKEEFNKHGCSQSMHFTGITAGAQDGVEAVSRAACGAKDLGMQRLSQMDACTT